MENNLHQLSRESRLTSRIYKALKRITKTENKNLNGKWVMGLNRHFQEKYKWTINR